jgi:hypothetical protein
MPSHAVVSSGVITGVFHGHQGAFKEARFPGIVACQQPHGPQRSQNVVHNTPDKPQWIEKSGAEFENRYC